jgi:hypothetical protein
MLPLWHKCEPTECDCPYQVHDLMQDASAIAEREERQVFVPRMAQQKITQC